MVEPQWITSLRHQYVGGEKWILIDVRGDRAVLKAPGRHFYSGQGQQFRYIRIIYYGVQSGMPGVVPLFEGASLKQAKPRIELWLNGEWQ